MPTTARPRRSSTAAAAAPLIVLAGALTACGSSGSSTESDDTSASDLVPEAEGTTSYPLTIDTWLGESTLEERPDRVAVFGYSSNLDSLEAIGVTPVYYGGRDVEADYAWNDPEYVDGIEVMDPIEDFVPNAEAIAASEPDLIVTPGNLTEQSQFDRLASIAPVLELPEDPGNGDRTDWRAVQAQVGEALDLSDAAESAVVEAEERIAAVAEEHPEYAGKTATIAYDYGPEFGLDYYTVTGGPAEGLMLDLGFEPNPLAENFVASPSVSDENQAQLDADALVMIYSTEQDREARESQQLFSSMPAVADDRYESLVYGEDAGPTDPLTTSEGNEAGNAVWVLRRGASAVALPWAAEVVADQWLADISPS